MGFGMDMGTCGVRYPRGVGVSGALRDGDCRHRAVGLVRWAMR